MKIKELKILDEEELSKSVCVFSVCNICGKEIKSDEKVISMDFSFCEEYDCGMNICLKCLERMIKLLK